VVGDCSNEHGAGTILTGNTKVRGDKPPPVVRGGADKSLARSTSRCLWTGSIVSLERGVCSCEELQVFSCYRG